MNNHIKEIKPIVSVFLLLLLVVLVSTSMLFFALPTRVTLLLSIVYACGIGLIFGHKASDLEKYVINGAKKSAFVVVILLVIGCVIGTWIAAGIIPTIIYYGLDVLSPSWFLVGGLVSCSLVSYFTGSSFACMGTIGVAVMGIGQGFGMPLPLVAGTVLSGALFGDKMSPFSDTTNLAAASSDAQLFDHIRSMTYTTIPAWFVSAGLFWYLGSSTANQTFDITKIQSLQNVISTHFNINPMLLLVPMVTIFLAARKTPPIMAMSFGAVLGITAAFIFQDSFTTKEIFVSLVKGLNYDFGGAEANKLFANRGGLSNMLYAVSIAMMALVLGEVLNGVGFLQSLVKVLEKAIFNTVSLVIGTIGTCLVTTLLSGSQYLAIVMPGEALQPLYRKRKVSRLVLSRSLEDGGTMFSMLVPWTGDAAFVVGALGVATLAYLPYAFFPILCPIFSITYAIIGFAVWEETNDEKFVEETFQSPEANSIL